MSNWKARPLAAKGSRRTGAGGSRSHHSLDCGAAATTITIGAVVPGWGVASREGGMTFVVVRVSSDSLCGCVSEDEAGVLPLADSLFVGGVLMRTASCVFVQHPYPVTLASQASAAYPSRKIGFRPVSYCRAFSETHGTSEVTWSSSYENGPWHDRM